MQIKLYQVPKLINSTARPKEDEEYILTLTAHLKDMCSRENPVFTLHETNLRGCNYVSCVFGDRVFYYFINSVTYISNTLIEIECSEDYLATYKDIIEHSTQFIERCSDLTQANLSLTDTLYFGVNGTFMEKKEAALLSDNGFYVVGILCTPGNETGVTTTFTPLFSRGTVSYVIMTQTQFDMVMDQLMNLSGLGADMSPIQYFVSAVYIPFDIGLTRGLFVAKSSHIKFGNLFEDTDGLQISYFSYNASTPANYKKGIYNKVVSLTLPVHPSSSKYGNYMNYAPWQSCRLYIPGFGENELDLGIMRVSVNDNTSVRELTIEVTIDLADGTAIADVHQDFSDLHGYIARINGNLGISAQMTQISKNSFIGTANAISNVGNSMLAFAGLQVGAGIASLGSAALSAYANSIPRVSSQGSNGSFALLERPNVEAIVESILPSGYDNERFGSLAYKTVRIGDIARFAFIKCRDSQIIFSCTRNEKEAIENMMNNGFHYE